MLIFQSLTPLFNSSTVENEIIRFLQSTYKDKIAYFRGKSWNFVLCKIPRHRALPSIRGLFFFSYSVILIFFYSALISSILSPVILAIISASIFSFFMLFAILSAAFCSPHSSPFVNPDFSPLQNPDFSPSFNPAS